MPQSTRIDRVRGCLLGLAVGDALGAPLEGLSAQQIRAHYGQVDDYVDGAQAWKKKPYRWRMPGLYSDDTQQALALCDVLLEHGRVDPDRLAELYLAPGHAQGAYVGAHRGHRPELPPGAGRPGARASRPAQTGQDSAGIGAAMRIAPVGLYFADEPDALFEAVMAASLMTHRDIRSLAGAMAVAHAVRRLLAGEARDPSFLLWLAADVARDEDRIAAEYADVGRLARPAPPQPLHGRSPTPSRSLDLPRERALAALVEEANRHGAEPGLQARHDGLPPGLHPHLPLPPADHRQLRGGHHRGRQPRRRHRHRRRDPRAPWPAPTTASTRSPTRWLDGLQNREAIDLRAEALARRSADGLEHPRPDRDRARAQRAGRRLPRATSWPTPRTAATSAPTAGSDPAPGRLRARPLGPATPERSGDPLSESAPRRDPFPAAARCG